MLGLLILLILVGVGLYLVGQIPMDQAILNIIRVVVLVFVVVYIFRVFGLFDWPVPRFR